MESQARYEVLCIAEAPNTADTRRLVNVLAQHEAATAIERALRTAGLPYDAWIIAADFADRCATEARALTAQLCNDPAAALTTKAAA